MSTKVALISRPARNLFRQEQEQVLINRALMLSLVDSAFNSVL